MESKGPHVSMKKTKFIVSSVDLYVLKKSGRYPCAVCCKGVSDNSIKHSRCKLWVHKKCIGITKQLEADANYICPWCKGDSRPIAGRPTPQVVVKGTTLMWRPFSAMWVACCALLVAVTAPSPPDAVWAGESSGNYCLSSLPGTSHLRCVEKCTRPVSAWLCSTVA